jgi:hypothetical protein
MLRLSSLHVGGAGLALCAGLFLLTGCATPAAPEHMTLAQDSVPPAPQGGPTWHALSVADVNGGGPTERIWLSNISDDGLRTALQASLKDGGYLAESGPARYQVSAHIIDLQQPIGSLDPVLWFAPVDWSVTIKVRYIVSAPGRAPLFDEVVAATGTAEGGSSLSSQGRVRRATEAAVRNDIQSFLTRLNSELKPPAA